MQKMMHFLPCAVFPIIHGRLYIPHSETTPDLATSTLGLCTRAAVGDVGIILGIYAAGALAAGDLGWGLRGRWNIYATTAFPGLAYAV